MTRIPVLDAQGVTVGQATVADAIAQQSIKLHLIHETAVAELAARRAGTHSTKTRSQVRGGGVKPWRQKGTGRARQGSIRAPQWTGGGIVFGPTPRSYGGKVNRKVRAQAFRAALRAHAERGTLALMDPTGWDAPSTKRAAEYLRQAPEGLAVKLLLVVVEDAELGRGPLVPQPAERAPARDAGPRDRRPGRLRRRAHRARRLGAPGRRDRRRRAGDRGAQAAGQGARPRRPRAS